MKFSRAGDARHLNPGGFPVIFCLALCLLASLLLFVWAKPVMSMPLTQPVRSLPFDQKTWYEANYDLSFQSCAFRPAALSIEDGILKTTIQKIKDGIICGSVNTWQKYKFGKFCITMMTAHAGAGMNTAFFLYTGQPTHGEIDIEILNKNPRQAQLTVWYHGVSDGGHIVDLGFDSSKAYHRYAINWQPCYVAWEVDGKEVYRTPLSETKRIPSDPETLVMDLWSNAPVLDSWMGTFAESELPASAFFKNATIRQ